MARCRKCGRMLGETRSRIPAAQEEPLQAVQPCNYITTPSEDLYGVTTEVIRLNTCCDPGAGCCKRYDWRKRELFWPAFAHPRWLSCELLYSRKI